MDIDKAERDFVNVFKKLHDSTVAKGNKPGNDMGIVSAIVYLGAKVGELTETIREMKKQ